MNPTACFKRTSTWMYVLVVGSLLACSTGPRSATLDESGTASDSGSMAMATDAAPGGTEQVSFSSPAAELPEAGLALNSNAETLLEPSANGLGLEMQSGPSADRIFINTAAREGDYKISRFNSPERVVIDLANNEVAHNQTINTNTASYVSQIRLGAHPDKSRIVLDLKENSPKHQSVNFENGKMVLTISDESSAPMAISDDAKASPRLQMTEQRDHDMGADSNIELKPVAPDAAQNGNIPSLQGMYLDSLGASSNALIAELGGEGIKYSLKKSAPSEYVLTLKNTSLDPKAAMTVLAPPAQMGMAQIRSVRPIVQGDDVMIRIFAAPNVALEAVAEGKKIVVKASDLMADVRAQMADESKAADAKKGNDVAKPAADAASPQVQVKDAQPATTGDESDVSALLGDEQKYSGRLISLDLQDTDIDNALRIIAEVSNLNIIASDDVTGKVTLRLIDVPWDQALDVILKTNALDKVQEGNVIRIAPIEKLRLEQEALKQVEQSREELEPLDVKYIRISYARAADMKPLVESVVTERGTVAYDDRTNQLIVKDIGKGIKNVAELVSRLDLRTPQVLLETQIVEAQRSLARELGAELGFEFIRSPQTGNATGYNFPNSIAIGGSKNPGSTVGSSFPAAIAGVDGAAMSLLFDSADGTQSLDARISALEDEGRVRVVSRPSVATTNNKQAIIKSVEKIRVKTPDGGLSVATGQGASAGGGSAVATETIEVGITLEVTPQASPDFFVLLDINAKSSTFGSQEVDGIPSEVERSATSTVLIASGQTFAMGGIYKISDKDSATGVPFFKDIPFIGHLFRRTGVDNKDEELIFFITPRIIEGSFDDAAMKAAS